MSIEPGILLAFIAALFMGLTLGMLGGGGSILTVPILVYLMGVPPAQATGWSLLVVGLTALSGSVRYVRAGLVDYRAAAYFAGPSIALTFLTRRFVLPSMPDPLLSFSGFSLGKDLFLMLLFAVVMLLAAVRMLRPANPRPVADGSVNAMQLGIQGAGTGLVAGLVGAGGGFLIVPALVLLAGMPMKNAVGASLLIIAAQSLIGFLGDLGAGQRVDWGLLLVFVAFAMIGVQVGARLADRVPGARLKTAFGWFVLLMGGLILSLELF